MRISFPHAAWVVQACGRELSAWPRRPDAALANGAELLLRAVREAALEDQRLLEANEVDLVPAGKHFGLDLIEPVVNIEHRDRRTAAVLPDNAELTAVDPINAVGVVDRHLAACRQRLDRMVDDGLF